MRPNHSTSSSLSRGGAATLFACSVVINIALAGLAVGWRPPGPACAPNLRPSAWLRQPASEVSDLRGRVVLIAFFGPCHEGADELVGHLTELDSHYGRVGLQVIGVCLPDGDVEADRGAIARLNPDPAFPVAIDAELACARQYGIQTSPTLVAIDRKGHIRHLFEGSGRWDDIDETLWTLLGEPVP